MTIKKLYRENYLGEEIVKDLTWENSQWHQTREYIPNRVINKHISNRAVVLGNGTSRLSLAPNFLQALSAHKGGLLGSAQLQTYGCNALYRDYTPDFLVATGAKIVDEIARTDYPEKNIVYTTQNSVLDYPGTFYLVPQNPNWNSGTLAAYLAAFDGHKKVYLIGFDTYGGQPQAFDNVYKNTRGYSKGDEASPESFFTKSLKEVMDVYNDVDFVRVMPTANWYMPEEWKYQVNLRQITFREFVTEVDL